MRKQKNLKITRDLTSLGKPLIHDETTPNIPWTTPWKLHTPNWTRTIGQWSPTQLNLVQIFAPHFFLTSFLILSSNLSFRPWSGHVPSRFPTTINSVRGESYRLLNSATPNYTMHPRGSLVALVILLTTSCLIRKYQELRTSSKNQEESSSAQELGSYIFVV